MPYAYQIDKNQRAVFAKGYGLFVEDDMREFRESLARDPEFDPGHNLLFDLTDVTRLDVSMAFVRQFARKSIWSATSKRAFVAPADVTFAGVRLFQAHHEDQPGETHVFRDRREALDWLGVTLDGAP